MVAIDIWKYNNKGGSTEAVLTMTTVWHPSIMHDIKLHGKA